MTKKDYQVIAALVGAIIFGEETINALSGKILTRETVLKYCEDYLSKTNPKFNMDVFAKAVNSQVDELASLFKK